MSDELQQLLDDQFPAPESSDKLKADPVENAKLPEWKNAAAALRYLADVDEGKVEGPDKDAPILRAVIVAQRKDGTLAVHGMGPEANDLSLIALLSLGLQQIQSEMLY